jgi:CRISPR-associated protein Csh2
MTNKEFLFLYDAANCNPNGDPDQENKPRMDRSTKTNLVSSFRLKRYIRDYLIDNETDEKIDVFVRQMGERKISVETRLMGEIQNLIEKENEFNALVEKDSELTSLLDKFKANVLAIKEKSNHEIFIADGADSIKSNISPGTDKKKKEAKTKEDTFIKNHKGYIKNAVLAALVKSKLIDIRFFGGAFAVKGFSQTFTGAIQVNLGYSLHPVELNTSNSLVTIMPAKADGDGNSTIGKKEEVFYSLIAFAGTMNAKKAEINGLSDDDLVLFRESLIKSILETRTESKKNQYPRFYLEIEYKFHKNEEGKITSKETYGRLGDLRNHIEVASKAEGRKDDNDFTKVRQLKELDIDLKPLFNKIKLIEDKIEKIRIWKSMDDDTFSDVISEMKNAGIVENLIEELTI